MHNQKELENFRIEIRDWLLNNCPESMRMMPDGDEDKCWGGKKWKFKNNDQKIWFKKGRFSSW